MVTVKLVSRSSGKPIKGKKVALGMEHMIGTGVTSGKWTDSNGEAHFDVNPGQGKVYVDGSKEHSGKLSGRVVVYI